MLFDAFEAKRLLVSGPILGHFEVIWKCEEIAEDFRVTLKVELGHFEKTIFYLFRSYTRTINQDKLTDQKYNVLVIKTLISPVICGYRTRQRTRV